MRNNVMDYNTRKVEYIQSNLSILFNDDKLQELWNEMDNTKAGANQIYRIEELNTILKNDEPLEIVRMTNHDEFSLKSANYFFFKLDNPNDIKIVSKLFIYQTPFFSYEKLAEYLIVSKSKELSTCSNELVNIFINTIFFGTEQQTKARKILKELIAFGMVNIIKDDWNKIRQLIMNLI